MTRIEWAAEEAQKFGHEARAWMILAHNERAWSANDEVPVYAYTATRRASHFAGLVVDSGEDISPFILDPDADLMTKWNHEPTLSLT